MSEQTEPNSLAEIQFARRVIEGKMKRNAIGDRYWGLYCIASLFLICGNFYFGGVNIIVGLLLSVIWVLNLIARIKYQRDNADFSLQLQKLDFLELMTVEDSELKKTIKDWNHP
jgi:Flp pilus assembly protein TadB